MVAQQGGPGRQATLPLCDARPSINAAWLALTSDVVFCVKIAPMEGTNMLDFKRWQVCIIAGICVLGALFAMPNLFSPETTQAWPWFVPKSRIKLDLEFTGGVDTILEADLASLRDSATKALRESVRKQMRNARIGYTAIGATPEGVRVRLLKPQQRNAAVDELRKLIGVVGASWLTRGTPDLLVTLEGADAILLTPTEAFINAEVIRRMDATIASLTARIEALTGPVVPGHVERLSDRRILIRHPASRWSN
jgi:preprotein translocase subunit SecD